jgi:hypothetical protein
MAYLRFCHFLTVSAYLSAKKVTPLFRVLVVDVSPDLCRGHPYEPRLQGATDLLAALFTRTVYKHAYPLPLV